MASQAAELKMPQAGGAQREPSMEEILASIRRIIEDSDQGRKPDDMLLPESAGPDAETGAMDMTAANAPKSKLELPQARMASEEPAAVSHPSKAARPEHSYFPEAPGAETAPVARFTEPEFETAEPVVAEEVLDAFDAAVPASMDVSAEPARREAVDAAPAPQASAPVETSSLISERTGRQVAAAFGELSEAFEASRRKSFDELAAEMMRPMLQDWLDNNLPTLVEKLVREEIERVARGGR